MPFLCHHSIFIQYKNNIHTLHAWWRLVFKDLVVLHRSMPLVAGVLVTEIRVLFDGLSLTKLIEVLEVARSAAG